MGVFGLQLEKLSLIEWNWKSYSMEKLYGVFGWDNLRK